MWRFFHRSPYRVKFFTTLLILFILFLFIRSLLLLLTSSNTPPVQPLPIYVVSLERATARRANIKRQLAGYNYTFFNAIDGWNLTESERQLVDRYIIAHSLKPTESACYLSHMGVWRTIIDQHLPYALIFEDDIVLRKRFRSLLPKFFEVITYDLVYFGHCFEQRNGTLLHTINSFEIRRSVKPRCIHAYIISQHGASTFLDYLNAHKTRIPIDMLMEEIFNQGPLTAVSVFPPLVSTLGMRSTIHYDPDFSPD